MKNLIKNCYFDGKTAQEAKEFIERCYQESVSIEKIEKEYKKIEGK